MTRYNFNLEMQDLCSRVAVAFKTVKKDDVLLPKVYYAAAQGFGLKSERLTAAQAEKQLPKELYERYKTFRSWVEEKEKEAAKIIA